MSYADLPNEHIKHYIFELLDPRTRILLASLVCKEWRGYCYRTLKVLSYCEHNRKCDTHLPNVNDDIISHIVHRSAHQLQAIHLCHVDGTVTRLSLNYIAQCTNLRSFLLCCASVDDEDAAQLKSLRHITSLNICFTKISTLDHFSNCASLKTLKFFPLGNNILMDPSVFTSFPHITKLNIQDLCFREPLFPVISTLVSLTSLRLRRCSFPFAHLAEIGKCTQLAKLTLWSNASEIKDEHLSGFATLLRLEKICMGPFSDDFTGEGLSYISECTRLSKFFMWHCTGLTSEGLSHLAKLNNLMYFSATHSLINDGDGFEAMVRLPKLQYMRIGFRQGVAPETLLALQDHKTLIELHLSASGPVFTAPVMSAIASIHGITTLSLFSAEGEGAPSEGLIAISKMPKLISFEVHNFDVTLDDVSLFATSPDLVNLVMRCCMNISPEGVLPLVCKSKTLQQIVMSRPDYEKQAYPYEHLNVVIENSH